MTGPRDWDRARANMLQHRRLIAARRRPVEQTATIKQPELEFPGPSRAERRAALLDHLAQRLHAVRRYFDPMGDHR